MLPLLILFACNPPAAAPADPGPVSVTIVAMNDFHGALYEKPSKEDPAIAHGGLPWLAGAVDALRADDPDLLLLDGGDSFQGDWPVNATKGLGSVRAFDLLGVDVAAIGNHEFDYGGVEGGHPLRGAVELAAKTRAQWATANVYSGDERWSPEGIEPWRIVERKGRRIGVIGLTTTETPQTTLLKNVEDLTFRDVVSSVNDTLAEMGEVDAVVVVGHLTGSCKPPGYLEPPGDDCAPDGEIGRLLAELPPGTVDVIVAGHAHTLLAHRIGDTFVLENRAQGHALGRLDLVIGPDGVDADASRLHAPWGLAHEPVEPGCDGGDYPLAPRDLGGRAVTPSAAAVSLVAELEDAAGGSLCERVACAAEPLGRERQGESAVGNLVADAMLAAFPDASFAIQNSGGLRNDVPAGELRKEHVHGVMPFDNRLLLVELSGAQAERLLQIGSSGAHGILQVAGAAYRVDPAAEGGDDLDGNGVIAEWERDRLCDVRVAEAPLDPGATYRVVTTDFLYAGGDHLGPAFTGARVLAEGPLLRDAITTHLASFTECIGAAAPIVDPARPRIEKGSCR